MSYHLVNGRMKRRYASKVDTDLFADEEHQQAMAMLLGGIFHNGVIMRTVEGIYKPWYTGTECFNLSGQRVSAKKAGRIQKQYQRWRKSLPKNEVTTQGNPSPGQHCTAGDDA